VRLATAKTAPAIGINYQVSISCAFSVDVRELTPVKAAPYLIALSTDFSIDPLISGEYPSNNPSSSWSDERRASAYTTFISQRDGQWQGYEQKHWQRTALLERYYTFQ